LKHKFPVILKVVTSYTSKIFWYYEGTRSLVTL